MTSSVKRGPAHGPFRAAGMVLATLVIVASPTRALAAEESPSGDITFGGFLTANFTEEYWDSLVAAFEAKYPDINVELSLPPSGTQDNNAYWQTQLAAGTLPDVISNVQITDWIKAEALLDYPIDDDIGRISYWEDNLYQGKLYELATAIQPINLIYYNKALFEQAGIDSPPTTFAELEEAMAKLAAADIVPLTTSGDFLGGINLQAFADPAVFGADPEWFTHRREGTVKFNEGAWLEAAEHIARWVDEGYIVSGANGLTYPQVTQDFLAGNAAMINNGPWFAPEIDRTELPFEVGVFAAPSLDGSDHVSVGRSAFCYPTAASDNPAAAIQFCKFMSLEEGHAMMIETDGTLSGLVDPPQIEWGPTMAAIEEEVQGRPITIIINGFGDEVPVPGLFNEVAAAWQGLMGGDEPATVLDRLDAYWDDRQAAGG
jgi:ABC-type glycerol-3-phosphate transport system substrate-binding protein